MTKTKDLNGFNDGLHRSSGVGGRSPVFEMEIVKSTDKTKSTILKKIGHGGDFHFFQNKRHQEFDKLIDDLCNLIIANEIDLFYFGGDIIDSKTKLSPEQVRAMRTLVRRVSDLVPTIWILGNHDLNLQNKDRLDSLTPFLEDIEPKHDVHFLKHSGVYYLYGINWAVWSCLDDQKSPFEVNPLNTLKKAPIIGCFHGVVDSALADSDVYKMKSNITVDEFKDCDVVFLNDIHKRQSFRNDEIQYSGSWCQIKMNEEESKGVLLWNWNNKEKKFKAEYVEIPKDFGYRTYEVQDLTTFKFPKDNLPRTFVPRLLYTGDANKFSPTLFEDLKKELQKKVDTQVVVQVKPFNNAKEVVVKSKGKVVDFFSTYFKAHNCTKEQIAALKEVDEHYNKLIDLSDYEVGQYVIEEVTIHNFMSYGPNNVVRLADIPGITGLFAPNRTGKSTLLDAMMFCFFNKTSRIARPGKELINDQINEEAYVEVIATLGGSRWRIKRTLTPKKDSASVSLEVYETINKKEIPRHKESRKDTEPMLRKMFGDAEIFLITSLCTQKKPVEFVDCTNAERLDLFLKFLGITAYEQKNELAKVDAASLYLECEVLRKETEGFQDEEKIKLEIEDFEKAIKAKEKTVDEKLTVIQTNTKTIETLRKSVEELVVVEVARTAQELAADLEVEKNKEEANSKLITTNKEKRVSAKKRWSEKVKKVEPEEWIEDKSLDQVIIDELSRLRELLGSLQLKVSKKTVEEWGQEKDKSQTLVAKLIEEKKQLTSSNESIVELWKEKELIEEWEPDVFANKAYEKEIAVAEASKKTLQEQLDSEICPTCSQKRKDIDKEAIAKSIGKQDEKIATAQDKINKLDKKRHELLAVQKTYNANKISISTLETRIATGESVIKTIGEEIAALNKNGFIQEERDKTLIIIKRKEDELNLQREQRESIVAIKKEIEQCNSSIELAEAQIELAKSKSKLIKQDLALLEKNKVNREKREKLKLIIEAHEQLIGEAQTVKQSEELQIVGFKKEIELRKVSIDQFAKKRKELLQKEQEYNNLQMYVESMHRSGIPLLLLQTYIPDINFEINDNLEGLFDFGVLFELDDKSLDIYFADNSIKKNKRSVALTSGLEGFVINLAIRAALTRISLLPKPSIFMIDEGFSVSDVDNLEPLKELLYKFKNQYTNIVMITHLDDLKDFPEHYIQLEKKEGITSILV